MNCCCPACRRTTHVPAEQHLARCQHCKAYFVARTETLTSFAADLLADPPPPLPPIHLADLLTPQEIIAEESFPDILETLAREIAIAPPPQIRQKELRRFRLRWRSHALGVISVCGLVAIMFLILAVIILKSRTFPQPASAAAADEPPSAPRTSSVQQKTTPRVEIESQPANTPEPSGDLFPNVPAQK